MVILTHLATFAFGILVTFVFVYHGRDGTLRINTYDPEKDVYSFEFKTPLNDIWRRKTIVFDVKVDSNSHDFRPL